jgi:hypothetical protein
MQVKHASAPRPQGPNEDCFRAGPGWALVLDGASRYPGRPGGCVHPVSWVVERLANHAAHQLTRRDLGLNDVLRAAIVATMADHGATCDLADPLSPGAAIAMVRTDGDLVDWLVLGDCAITFDLIGKDPLALIDDRVDHLPGAPVTDGPVRTYDPDYVATVRNRPGGFWLAGARPEAADHAMSGRIRYVPRLLLCTDGVTRLVERHGWPWRALFDLAEREGPGALIRAVRTADAVAAGDPKTRQWRGKLHDDATVALVQLVDQADGRDFGAAA